MQVGRWPTWAPLPTELGLKGSVCSTLCTKAVDVFPGYAYIRTHVFAQPRLRPTDMVMCHAAPNSRSIYRQLVVLAFVTLFYVPAVAQSVAPVANAASGVEEDHFVRFLSDRGLIPSTQPVVGFAKQAHTKASELASELVVSAMNFLGVPYRMGGSSPESGFDCSGFTRHVFENSVGLLLPRRSIEQAQSPDLEPVKQSELKPGDLVFFNTLRRTFSHVGIYIGDHKFIHSPRAGSSVRVEDMRISYWQQRFDGARRVPALSTKQGQPKSADQR